MNVFLKDEYLCIGCTHERLLSRSWDFIEMIIKPSMRDAIILDGEDVVSTKEYRTECYDFDKVRHSFENLNWYSETRVLRVKPDQDVSPLNLKPYCQVGWMQNHTGWQHKEGYEV